MVFYQNVILCKILQAFLKVKLNFHHNKHDDIQLFK